MEKSIQQLKDTLIKENEMYTDILKLAEQKTEIIIKGDIKTLENITKKEQQFITTMNTFEKIRRSVLTNIVDEIRSMESHGESHGDRSYGEAKRSRRPCPRGIPKPDDQSAAGGRPIPVAHMAHPAHPTEDFTISELLLFIEEDTGNDIDELRYKLLETINTLKEVNKSNEKLINQNLQYINFNLEILTQSSEDGNKYNNTASESKEAKPINLFDMKV